MVSAPVIAVVEETLSWRLFSRFLRWRGHRRSRSRRRQRRRSRRRNSKLPAMIPPSAALDKPEGESAAKGGEGESAGKGGPEI